MKRGDVCVGAARGAFTSKPRPFVIIQDDRFDASISVTVCPLTTHLLDLPVSRPRLEPTATNGLDRPSQLMVDKVTTVPRESLGPPIGRLSDADVLRLDRALIVFLGLAA